MHGVSGTAPRDMLYTDPVARDEPMPGAPRSFTTVYRKPDRDADVDAEAFHWGGLTAGSWRTAFWILLAPFAFANIAGWMAARQGRAGHAAIRTAGLALTALFVSQTAVVLIDMPYHWLSTRVEGFWLRIVMFALFALFGTLFFLLVQKASAQSHFQELDSGQQFGLVLATDPRKMLPAKSDEMAREDDPAAEAEYEEVQWDDPAGATLADEIVWRPHAILHRLRRLHLAAGMLVIAMTSARGTGQVMLEWATAGVFAVVVVLLVATTFTPKATWVKVATAWAPALAMIVVGWSLVVFWFSILPASDHWTGVHETTFQIALFMFAAGAMVLLFSGLAPLGAFAIGAQLGGALGIAAAVVFEYAIDVNEVRSQGAGWTAVAMLFLIVIIVFLAGRLARPWDGSDLGKFPDDRDKGRSRRLMTVLRRVTVDARAVFNVAAVFAIAAGLVAVYFGCVGTSGCSPFNLGVPSGASVIASVSVLAVAVVWWAAHRILGLVAMLIPIGAGIVIGALYLRYLEVSVFGIDLELTTLVGVSIAVTILVPASFMANSLIRGFRDAERRRRVGILWDIASFFPRWYHPLAPPAYGPFVVQKLKNELQAHPRDLLAAHSQGAMIALVTLGQMEESLPRGFLTYGCQLGVHYPANFPAAGIPELVDQVRRKLNSGQWISLWRPNDPLGGPVGSGVADREVTEAVGHSGYELTGAYQMARNDLS
ncbi:MAG: hypothetical protein ACRDZM_19325 [Acidimicrobiia bacterium]